MADFQIGDIERWSRSYYHHMEKIEECLGEIQAVLLPWLAAHAHPEEALEWLADPFTFAGIGLTIPPEAIQRLLKERSTKPAS